MTSSPEKLRLQGLHKGYANQAVLRGIDLSVNERDFICFLGPSGCGKSTLLRCIAGLEKIDQGQIFIDGQDLTHAEPAERDLAMVFQSYALYPHMNVAKNMGFGLSLQGVAKSEIQRRVSQAAQILQLQDLLERKPKQLSGGQRQRVAIGRAIVRQPKLFLFDEPLSNLDAELRAHTRIELARLHQELAATMIYVTHDQVEAMTLANKVLILNGGKAEQFGTPLSLYERPANRFVAGFIGSPRMNFLAVALRHAENGEISLQLAQRELKSSGWHTADIPAAYDGKFELGIRPEHLQVCDPAQADLLASVELIERLGAESLLYLQSEAGKLCLRLNGNVGYANGDNLGLHIPESAMHLFLADGRAITRE